MFGLRLGKLGAIARAIASFSFSPASLFAAGEPGAWYDPSDIDRYMTPLGPELVSNGDFSAGTTGWSASGGVLVASSGKGLFTKNAFTSAGITIAAALSTEIGKTYVFSGTYEKGTTATNGFLWVSNNGDGSSYYSQSPSSDGTLVVNFIATATTTYVGSRSDSMTANTTYLIDNISVRELTAIDTATMYQDAAGTTPVTAVEQPVGRMLDKSGTGAHATQSTATSRPVLSARVNMFTKTEQFDDGSWFKNAHTITANAAIAPDGTMTADKLVAVNGTDPNQPSSNGMYQSISLIAGVPYLISFYAKAAEFNILRFRDGAQTGAFLDFNLTTGAITNGNASRFISPVAEPDGSGWYRISFTTGSITSSVAYPARIGQTGDGTSGIYIWGASLVPANQASLPYQRVNTATDYDTVGFPHYLRCDGIDDGMVTGTITPGTDKAQVFAGVRTLSNANYGGVVGLGATVGDNGSFLFWLRSAGGGGQIEAYGRGSTSATSGLQTAASALTVPSTFVSTIQYDIAQAAIDDEIKLRLNGAAQASTGSSTAGTGVFSSAAMNIGQYNGANRLNGNIHSLIVRFGPTLTEAQITQTETWVNGKTGAY